MYIHAKLILRSLVVLETSDLNPSGNVPCPCNPGAGGARIGAGRPRLDQIDQPAISDSEASSDIPSDMSDVDAQDFDDFFVIYFLHFVPTCGHGSVKHFVGCGFGSWEVFVMTSRKARKSWNGRTGLASCPKLTEKESMSQHRRKNLQIPLMGGAFCQQHLDGYRGSLVW